MDVDPFNRPGITSPAGRAIVIKEILGEILLEPLPQELCKYACSGDADFMSIVLKIGMFVIVADGKVVSDTFSGRLIQRGCDLLTD